MSVDVDLHLHSTASDGRLAPRELVAHAVAAGVRMLALTDHDSVDGLGPAEDACHALGATFVTGVELSAGWRGRSIHVVGLGIDPAAAALTTIITSLADVRVARAERIAAKLDKARAPGTAALALALAQNPRPTRTHFARALVELGAAPDLEAAFKRYLGHGAPAHVTTDWPALADAVAAIVAAGGLAVLAHPLRYRLSAGARRELGHEFRETGGVALEVATAGTTADQLEQATALAVRTGLDGSCGSDFHDPANPWIQPGRLAKLPLSVRPVWRRLGLPAHVSQQA